MLQIRGLGKVESRCRYRLAEAIEKALYDQGIGDTGVESHRREFIATLEIDRPFPC